MGSTSKKVGGTGNKSGVAVTLKSSTHTQQATSDIILVPDSSYSLSLTTTTLEVEDTANTAQKITVPRKSFKVQAQIDPSSTMSKAIKRVYSKEVRSSSTVGIPLINNFPYNRLTVEQISELFRVYQITLSYCKADTIPIR